MVYVTPGIRWLLGLWCALAVGLAAGVFTNGAALTSVGLLAALLGAPAVVLAALTRFRPEARTSSQVLYDESDHAE